MRKCGTYRMRYFDHDQPLWDISLPGLKTFLFHQHPQYQKNYSVCPKCGFQADLPPTQMIFACPIEDCRFQSCRKCGKEAHIPLRCDEVVRQERQDEGRLKVEEAISAAKIRTCPKCKASFIKSDGCNKMTCRCGAWLCYLCRIPISQQEGYAHFCQQPHCDHKCCKKCRLYSNAEEDDALAMREAGVVAAESFREQVLGETDSGIANGIHIDVDSILRDPKDPKPSIRKSFPAHPQGELAPRREAVGR